MEVRTMWRSGKGFTLIELMVVIAIILILALIAVPAYRNMQIRAKKARAQEDLRNIATALEAFFVDWNQYPEQSTAGEMSDEVKAELTGGQEGSGASINTSSHTSATGETGPISYINSIPDDPFNPGHTYYYECDDGHSGPWYLWSVGPDGTSDDRGDDDIVRTNS